MGHGRGVVGGDPPPHPTATCPPIWPNMERRHDAGERTCKYAPGALFGFECFIVFGLNPVNDRGEDAW